MYYKYTIEIILVITIERLIALFIDLLTKKSFFFQVFNV